MKDDPQIKRGNIRCKYCNKPVGSAVQGCRCERKVKWKHSTKRKDDEKGVTYVYRIIDERSPDFHPEHYKHLKIKEYEKKQENTQNK